jgi:hypothetical protein
MTPRHSTIALAFAAALLLIPGSGQPAAARDGPSPALRASPPRPVRPAGVGTVMYFPVIFRNAPPQAIIVDHTSTDLSRIPAYWIEQAKGFVVHYAHTSHGSQVLSGLEWLEGQDATYSVQVTVSGGVANPATPGALSFYDGNNYPPSNTYITPDLYWEYADGVTHTRSVADTGWFDYSTWTWCGQASSYSTEQIQLYLDTLNGLEQDYPGMRFIYMTGHTDGTGPSGPLYQNSNQVRQYARDHGKVLFDFADIESYDPDGTYYPDTTDACPWCASYCTAHPSYCADFASMGDCAHTHKLLCKMKAQAWWWLMARLAGWGGPP